MKIITLHFIIFQLLSILRRFFFHKDELVIVNILIALAETVFGILFLTSGVKYFLKSNKKAKNIISAAIIVVASIFFLCYVTLFLV